MSFSKKGRKRYLRNFKDASISAAQNGVYYLPKGKYTVKIDEAQTAFSIK